MPVDFSTVFEISAPDVVVARSNEIVHGGSKVDDALIVIETVLLEMAPEVDHFVEPFRNVLHLFYRVTFKKW
jgi:hypothetical protein